MTAVMKPVEEPKTEQRFLDVSKGNIRLPLFQQAEQKIINKYTSNLVDSRETSGYTKQHPAFHTYVLERNGKVEAVVQGWDISVGGKQFFFECYAVGKVKDVRDIYDQIIKKPIVVEVAPNETGDKKALGFMAIMDPVDPEKLFPYFQLGGGPGNTMQLTRLPLAVRGTKEEPMTELSGDVVRKLPEAIMDSGAYSFSPENSPEKREKDPRLADYHKSQSQVDPNETYKLGELRLLLPEPYHRNPFHG